MMPGLTPILREDVGVDVGGDRQQDDHDRRDDIEFLGKGVDAFAQFAIQFQSRGSWRRAAGRRPRWSGRRSSRRD